MPPNRHAVCCGALDLPMARRAAPGKISTSVDAHNLMLPGARLKTNPRSPRVPWIFVKVLEDTLNRKVSSVDERGFRYGSGGVSTGGSQRLRSRS